ncbi:HAD family hydrolase [Jiella sp. MQZ9-1]|uniref:HAD family hydrolase n=1 Tax=Jiella flava TaxID=2816857 RepID=A0A939FWY1_9HYPH|nr:HAD family hydrolase [Jiella flava]MBO0663027.1 HAD family hydrolase [Jiella flava]MCD2471446.1 HAD family hydrolase [Jiella flava]
MSEPIPRIVVFDLDDTLYLERDYATSGFRAAATTVFAADPALAERVAKTCQDLFDAGLRQMVFDASLDRCGVTAAGDLVSRLVSAYRHHHPRIALAPDAARYLDACPTGTPLALITDGPPASQRAKIAALGLESRIAKIVCTGELGEGRGKPHPEAFEEVERWAELPADRLVYVADNAAKDFLTPRRRGWASVQILRPGRIHRHDPPGADYRADRVIRSLDALDAGLDALDRKRLTAMAGPAQVENGRQGPQVSCA